MDVTLSTHLDGKGHKADEAHVLNQLTQPLAQLPARTTHAHGVVGNWCRPSAWLQQPSLQTRPNCRSSHSAAWQSSDVVGAGTLHAAAHAPVLFRERAVPHPAHQVSQVLHLQVEIKVEVCKRAGGVRPGGRSGGWQVRRLAPRLLHLRGCSCTCARVRSALSACNWGASHFPQLCAPAARLPLSAHPLVVPPSPLCRASAGPHPPSLPYCRTRSILDSTLMCGSSRCSMVLMDSMRQLMNLRARGGAPEQ